MLLPRRSIGFYFACLVLIHCTAVAQDVPLVRDAGQIKGVVSKIAFGSCGHQDHEQPILDTVVAHQPDLFIYLGDNIYGDTTDMKVLQAKYDKLGSKKRFQNLRSTVPVLSIWDDHDYGWNDAGKEYPKKEESKAIFMDFWKVPKDSDRRKRAGIFGSHFFSDGKNRVQVILLDTRTFRDSLKRNPRDSDQPKDMPKESKFKNAYQPDASAEKTLLGDAQWKWLAAELAKPADLRVICSSIQFGHEYNGHESWTNLPLEQQKMFQTIRDAKANGVVFISGDVHWGEISKRKLDGLYPIYDVTASGLTMDWHNTEPNRFRVGEVWRKNHFGMIEIDWQSESPSVSMKIIDVAGNTQVEHAVPLSQLRMK